MNSFQIMISSSIAKYLGSKTLSCAYMMECSTKVWNIKCFLMNMSDAYFVFLGVGGAEGIQFCLCSGIAWFFVRRDFPVSTPKGMNAWEELSSS